MELLSPAGNFEAFIGAVNAGADAVYIGGSRFGARAYADNFSDEEITKAIEYAHLYNVKVYLTVNTLIKEREWDECISYIKKFYNSGLDACIVQDLGLISVFSECFPNMECHVSTQGFSTGLNSVLFYKRFGAERVVLARELSLDEIVTIKNNTDVELETFIHGAMCYSYSGECLFSSCLGGRSGNRGRCAGPCRLPYKFEGKKEQYFLSMKDQCTLKDLPRIISAGIDSLKIEGRMKKPEYTAFVTHIYRKYIDLYNNNPDNFHVDSTDFEKLKHIYLRSEIGNGYYFKQNGKEMLTFDCPAYSGNDEAVMEFARNEFLSGYRRLPVNAFFSSFHGSPVSLTLTCKDCSVCVVGNEPQKSHNSPITAESIEKQISKLGDSYFFLSDFLFEMDEDCFIPVSELNDLRRRAVAELTKELTKKEVPANNKSFELGFRKHTDFNKLPIVSITSLNQFNAVKDYSEFCYICVPSKLLLCEEVTAYASKCFVKLPEVLRIKDSDAVVEIVKKAIDFGFLGIIADNFEALEYLKDYHGVILCGSGLYCFNKKSVEAVQRVSDAFVFPYELSSHEINDLKISGCYLNVYGRIPLMRTANCVLKSNVSCRKNAGNEFVYITDRMNASFPVYRNCDMCFNIIFNSVPTFLENQNNYYSFISFTDETDDEIKRILNHYILGEKYEPVKFTKAYWKHGVE